MHLETEDELWERIERATGDVFLATIDSGLQGTVYMLEEHGLVAKITHSRFEAATAVLLMSEPDPCLPRVVSVHGLTVQGEQRYLVVREDLVDLVESIDEEDDALLRHFANAFINVKYPDWISEEIVRSREFVDREHAGLTTAFAAVLDGVAGFNARTGVEVSDIHFKNLGQRPDGGIVLRDFGMTLMTDDECDDLLEALAMVPDGESSLVRRAWR